MSGTTPALQSFLRCSTRDGSDALYFSQTANYSALDTPLEFVHVTWTLIGSGQARREYSEHSQSGNAHSRIGKDLLRLTETCENEDTHVRRSRKFRVSYLFQLIGLFRLL
jgi:hypothetical protein